MSIEELKTMKSQLMSCVQAQMGNLQQTDTKELGQAIDMIKDLAEAAYYCTITQAMEKGDQSEQRSVNNINYYTTPTEYMRPDYRDGWHIMKDNMMYYPGMSGTDSGQSTTTTGGGRNYYTQPIYGMMRDPRQGRSAIRRRMYMEGKQKHLDVNSQLHELQAYLQELSSDITEMIKDASPEERATLHQKMMTLANKIG